MQNSQRFRILSGLAMIGQLGMQVVLPPVIFTLLAVWANMKFDIGVWLPIAALAVGLLTGGCCFYRIARVWLLRNSDADMPASTQEKEKNHED